MTHPSAQAFEGPWWKEPTRPQWLTFGAAWLGWVLDAFDFMVFLLVQRQIAKEFNVSAIETGFTILVTLVIRLVGGYVAGSVADRFGRKLPLMISMIWFALANGSIYFAHSWTLILVLRFLFGFGMGAEYTSGTTMAMENWPARSRSIASGILQGSWGLGFILAALAVRWIVPEHGWRPLFLLGALPALLAVPIRFLVPESEEAKKERAASKPVPLRGLSRRIFFASIGMGLGMMAYYAFISHYAWMLQKDFGLPLVTAMDLSIVFNIGFFVGAAICGYIIKRKGIIAAVVGPALLSLPILVLYVGRLPSGLLPTWCLWIGAFLGGAIGVGWSGMVPIYLTGIFPPAVRARAVGIVYHIAAAMGALVPVGIPLIMQATGWSFGKTMGIVIAVLEVALALALLLQPKDMVNLSEMAGVAGQDADSEPSGETNPVVAH